MAILDKTALEALWIQAGGTPGTADVASAIALAESKGDTAAIDNTNYPRRPNYHPAPPGSSKEFSVGLWQINLLAHPTYTQADMLVALKNAQAAVAISNKGADFGAWSTYTNHAYRAYLEDVIGGALATGSGQPQTPPPTPAPKVSPPVAGPGKPPPATADVPADVFLTWAGLRSTLGVGVPQRINRARAAAKAMRDAVR